MFAYQAGDFINCYLERHLAPRRWALALPAWVIWLAVLLVLGCGWVSLHQNLILVSYPLLTAAFAVAGVSAARKKITGCLLLLSLSYLLWETSRTGAPQISQQQYIIASLCMLAGYLLGQLYNLQHALRYESMRSHLLEQLSEFILQLDDGCLKEVDLQGRLKSMNAAGRKLMEVTDFSQIQDCNWSGFWPDECHDLVQHAFAEARQGRTGRFSGFAPTLSGVEKYWDVLIFPVVSLSNALESFLVFSRDISDLQHQTQQAHAAAHTFQSLLENLNDGFLSIDKNGCFLQINSRAEELLGYKSVQLIGMRFQDVFTDDLSGEFATAACDIIGAGIPRHFEAYFNPLQRWCRVDAYPKADGIYIFFNDITDRVEALQESQATEARLRLTQKVARFADWQFDLATNNAIFSEQALLLLGAEGLSTEFIKKDWLRLFHPDDRLPLVAALLDLKEGETFLSVQVRTRDPVHAGKWRYFQLLGERLTSQTTPKGLLAGCIQDVSEQKQYEHRLVNAETYAQSVINAVPQPFCVLDETGEIFSVNQAWINYFQQTEGLEAWAGTGSRYTDLLRYHYFSSPELLNKINALLNGTGDPFVLKCVVNLAEKEKTLQVTALPMTTEARQFLVIHENIHEA